MSGPTADSIERFERLCFERRHEPAGQALLALLNGIETRFGVLGTGEAHGPGRSDVVAEATRVASAIACLFADPGFTLAQSGFDQLIQRKRWIDALFSVSAFGNADHVLRALSASGDAADLALDRGGLLKFCLLYTPDSAIPLKLEALFDHDKTLGAALGFALLSSRFLGADAAHASREALLGWLPRRLAELDRFDALPTAVLHDVYLNCSYADRPDKHDIRRAINAGLRRQLLAAGDGDLDVASPRGERDGKPIALVAVEWFTGHHSAFRPTAASVRGMRERFHVVGVGLPTAVDPLGREVFDAFVPLDPIDIGAQVRGVRELAARLRPSVIYAPSVGMMLYMLYVTNLRLAPVQATSIGHGASTQSPFVDYFALEEELAGDPATFSEAVLKLPRGGMPFVRSSAARPVTASPRAAPETVRVAVAASAMKINPRLIAALRAIAERARTPVRFEFLVAHARGLVREQIDRFVTPRLPNATIHAELPYAGYLRLLADCDLCLDPFPYGNVNGVADAAYAGLVGVCRTGPQLHEHMDGALFARLGLPDWLIADTDEAYVAAAVRLIDDPAERLALRRALIARGGDTPLLRGRPEALGERLLERVRAGG